MAARLAFLHRDILLSAVQSSINSSVNACQTRRGGVRFSGKCPVCGQQEMIGVSVDLWGSADPSLIELKRPGARSRCIGPFVI
jgi:hypothetical protein